MKFKRTRYAPDGTPVESPEKGLLTIVEPADWEALNADSQETTEQYLGQLEAWARQALDASPSEFVATFARKVIEEIDEFHSALSHVQDWALRGDPKAARLSTCQAVDAALRAQWNYFAVHVNAGIAPDALSGKRQRTAASQGGKTRAQQTSEHHGRWIEEAKRLRTADPARRKMSIAAEIARTCQRSPKTILNVVGRYL